MHVVGYKKETDLNAIPRFQQTLDIECQVAILVLVLLFFPACIGSQVESMAFLILLVSVCVSLAQAQRFVPGYCPAPVPQENFDKTKVSPVSTSAHSAHKNVSLSPACQ